MKVMEMPKGKGVLLWTGRRDAGRPQPPSASAEMAAHAGISLQRPLSKQNIALGVSLLLLIVSVVGLTMEVYAQRAAVNLRHQTSGIRDPPARALPVRESPSRSPHKYSGLPRQNSPVDDADSNTTSWAWTNAGGRFGLSADWRNAVSVSEADGEVALIRSNACSKEEKKEEVARILEKRMKSPWDQKVAACLRTKDFGRFLPEWVAYHYVLGVDEVMIYDDESVDGTHEILEPFINAGIAHYRDRKVKKRRNQMQPLNDCLAHYIRKRKFDRGAPLWLLLHDSDEYILPLNTSLSLSEAIQRYNGSCCALVHRVQYGSGGYRETPRGLVLENFVTHASVYHGKENRLPKLVVNLEPMFPELGVVTPPLPSMHGVKGDACECEKPHVTDIRINHYLGSTGDFMDKTRRYWQENHSEDKVKRYLVDRDVNSETSTDIIHWACATREILARAAVGADLII